MTLGGKIKEARTQCGLSQTQLADKLCVSRSAIAKWETDKGLPDIGNLKILSRLLNVSVDYLLDDTQDGPPVIRESFALEAFGRGCKKVIKDRVIRDKFPNARIYTLFGRNQIPSKASIDPQTLPAATCKSAGYNSKDQGKEFYLVEHSGRQFLVTVTDTFLESRLLEQPITENSFSLDGWRFIKYNYEVE